VNPDLISKDTAGTAGQFSSTKYDPAQFEDKWYKAWEASGIFKGDPSSKKPAFSIVIPPPNVTGSLHIGHALNNTLQDILARRKRMQGFDVLWVPGCDHAGIATQNVVERQLAKEKLTRHDLGREKFIERVWTWKKEYGDTIMRQLRRLGSSLDWSRERFTMDEGLSEAVKEVFIRLHQEGLIYQGDYIINWCPRCRTALSDIETEHEDVAGHFWHLRYPLAEGKGELVVATTRPETMLGDTAVAVHPEDERYQHLIGKKVRLPLMDREIPVIADTYVDREFGTGVVKITPAHDPNDFLVGDRHNLPRINVMNPDGTMSAEAGKYQGLDRFVCRKQVVADLEAGGYLVKVEDHAHAVGHCYRCHTVVDPYLSRQWFVKMKPLAATAIEAYDQGKIGFTPDHWGKVFRDWLENTRDWCISRQLWWGHRIPIWYCDACGEVIAAKEAPDVCPKCKSTNLRQDPDVLDTWFSSGLWPFSTLGWPESTPELKRYYPTSVLVTSWDIIFFWVARMAMMGLKFMGDVPFHHVCINSLVGDAEGKKMSKSKGNTVDPLDIMVHTGADGLRFTMAAIENHSRYVAFTPDRLESSRNFMNKIWNAARFAAMNLEGYVEPAQAPTPDFADRWILSRLEAAVASVNEALEGYRFGEAAQYLYDFFWHEYCDWYLEIIKERLFSNDQKRDQARYFLLITLDESLRLLHPFIPFITDEIWSHLPGERDFIMKSPWPISNQGRRDETIEKEMKVLQEIGFDVLNIRGEINIPIAQKVPLVYKPINAADVDSLINTGIDLPKLISANQSILIGRTRLSSITFDENYVIPQLSANATAFNYNFIIPLEGIIDIEKERERLVKQITNLKSLLDKQSVKLSSPTFLERAPRDVVEAERAKEIEYKQKINGCTAALARLEKK
jgi:valyl-tRNA synthetase